MEKGAENYQKYLSGDDSGMAALVIEYRDGLVLYLNGIVRSMATAEDIAEDTFFKLMTKKPRYKEDAASFRTWLYGMGRNIAYDKLRREKRITYTDLSDDPASPGSLEDAYIKSELHRALHRCLQKLPPDKYELVWLTYFENMSAKQTAKITGKREGAVFTALSRIRAELKEMLDLEGYNDENL